MVKNYEQYFDKQNGVCGGQTVIRGTRIRLKVVLDNLAEGHTPEEIVRHYPSLSLESVHAVIAYAAAAASDENTSPLPTALSA